MRCKNCGSKYLKTDKFCPACGKKLDKSQGVIGAAVVIMIVALIGLGVTALMSEGVFAPGRTDIALPEQTQSGTSETAETTTSATETTTSAAKTTTTTQPPQSDPIDEVRRSLVNKKWKAEIIGFNAVIDFENDGSAQVELSVLFTKMTVPGTYKLGDDWEFTLEFSYGDKNYRAAGELEKVSDTVLIAHVDSQKFTLTAID